MASRLLPDDLPRRVATGKSHDATARMTACAAEVEARDRRAVLRGTRHRTEHEELIERELRVMPVPARHAELALEILRGEELARLDAVPQPRGVDRESLDDAVGEGLAPALPAARERRGCVLHDHRHDLLTGRRA